MTADLLIYKCEMCDREFLIKAADKEQVLICPFCDSLIVDENKYTKVSGTLKLKSSGQLGTIEDYNRAIDRLSPELKQQVDEQLKQFMELNAVPLAKLINERLTAESVVFSVEHELKEPELVMENGITKLKPSHS